MAKVLSVNISDRKGVQKQPIDQGYFSSDWGLKNDAHGGAWHRQVSLLGVESINKMRAQGLPELVLGDFAENITTEGLGLFDLPIGTKLAIGETIMEVTQIGKECHNGCAIRQKVGDCIMPREGIFAKVLQDGWVRSGDGIRVFDRPEH